MAKLSARGRTVIAEAVKTVNSSYDGKPIELKHRLMSDGVVLRKSGSGWSVKGKLKEGVTNEQWVQGRRETGWTVNGQLPIVPRHFVCKLSDGMYVCNLISGTNGKS